MKEKTTYTCSNCGIQKSGWIGKCPECSEWNTFVEKKILPASNRILTPSLTPPMIIKDIPQIDTIRKSLGNHEVDRLLGGGCTPGAVTLIGGEPGIGKSTLLMQIAGWAIPEGWKVLYISGEESVSQVSSRALRVSSHLEQVYLYSETSIQNMMEQMDQIKPNLVIIDSIQMVQDTNIQSAPGSPQQIRESSYHLTQYAKHNNIALFIIGHITKEGQIAGPKLLEHIVDTVLYFENSLTDEYRLLRVFKNRFGPTHEVLFFEMTAQGLSILASPSKFLCDTENGEPLSREGSALVPIIGGAKSILVEVQALVCESKYSSYPKRVTTCIDNNRVALLLALIEKKAQLPLGNCDVFVNISGGIKTNDVALDLGICAAVISSYYSQSLPKSTIFIGEIGLNGEVRKVKFLERRLQEAIDMEIHQAIIPDSIKINPQIYDTIQVIRIKHIKDCIQLFKRV